MKTLAQLFGSFRECAAVPRVIADGVVTKVNIINEVRVVTLWVDFPALVEREALLAAEKA